MTTVGIVGCGRVAKAHVAALARRQHLEVAFCDRNTDRAAAMARANGSDKVYTEFEEMIEREHLRALHVLTRVDSHASIARRALSTGTHVYVEKPITESRTEFDQARLAAEEAGCVFYPGFSALGSPAVQAAMNLVHSQTYGRLITAHCDYNWTPAAGGIPYGSGGHPAYELRGGILQNLADHPASIIVHLLDDVLDSESTRQRRSTLPNRVHDLLHVTLLGPGQIGSFTMSFGHGSAQGNLACHLEGATIEVDLRSHVVTVTPFRGVPSFQRRVLVGLRNSAATSGTLIANAAKRATRRTPASQEIAALIENFYATIDGQAAAIVDLDKSAIIVDVLDSVWSGDS